ncbi:hypothetical protein Glove_46g75 [Diversispora epigaea]|uniref:ATP-dependent DNA helicase n=1 Tax=Diversispora epigaea TaxID=1348612 RepID=A0A397JP57_9GLOM|nr:hypothetical protein Glove_46g75 [Diversispora epigaea]
MEIMFLLFGEKICNSSIKVIYPITNPPSTQINKTKCLYKLFRKLKLFSTLKHITSKDIQNIIKAQINSIKLLSSVLPTNIITDLPPSQYFCIQMIKTYLGSRDKKHCQYFFITGSAGTGKSFIINLILNDLKNFHKEYLLMAPTGVAAHNINGQTIHSALQIHSIGSSYQTLS